ncbi:hypothetical protein NEOLEDRAFT_657158 [Neolentinus lepideus HHB14362 ss-1]|uniref:Secreted protein n=1 Tax=Neolentinus lepideus HHB14362 ss-1 TaxID=1314782 RepID=A0A165QFR0_9AGAM|nr:hypothetical protein NEOLEDRAFT_657158 [Neolentinus lepideus HHB14362 ss-1]
MKSRPPNVMIMLLFEMAILRVDTRSASSRSDMADIHICGRHDHDEYMQEMRYTMTTLYLKLRRLGTLHLQERWLVPSSFSHKPKYPSIAPWSSDARLPEPA